MLIHLHKIICIEHQSQTVKQVDDTMLSTISEHPIGFVHANRLDVNPANQYCFVYSHYYIITLLHYYIITLLHYYIITLIFFSYCINNNNDDDWCQSTNNNSKTDRKKDQIHDLYESVIWYTLLGGVHCQCSEVCNIVFAIIRTTTN